MAAPNYQIKSFINDDANFLFKYPVRIFDRYLLESNCFRNKAAPSIIEKSDFFRDD
jgi:hypothetical protein